MTLSDRVAEALGVEVRDAAPLSGGCIAQASRLELADGRTVFAKTAGASGAGFACEAAGLRALAEHGRTSRGDWVGPRVPEVLHAANDLLVLSWLELAGPAGADTDTAWGEALAMLHRRSAEAHDGRFGFDLDGVLGSSPQANGWCDDWPTFWRTRRLQPMLDRLADDAETYDEITDLGGRLLDGLDALLDGHPPEASLVHGDLWSGNVGWVDDGGREQGGAPATFDPAAHFASREAEFGMTRWMGGFGPAFEAAYQNLWPLPEGSDRRIRVYELHHHLNHLHLFGPTYRAGCLRLLRQILAA